MSVFLKKLHRCLAVTAMIVLAGCGSIPVSTLAEVSKIDVLSLEPRDVQVAIIVPEAVRFRRGDIVMDIGWSTKQGGGGMNAHFALDLLTGNAAAPSLGRMLKVKERLYLLTLNAADAEQLRAMQAAAWAARAQGNMGKGRLSIGFAGGCTADEAMRKGPLHVSAHLRVQAGQEFLPLIDDLDMMGVLQQAGLSEVPFCVPEQPGPA